MNHRSPTLTFQISTVVNFSSSIQREVPTPLGVIKLDGYDQVRPIDVYPNHQHNLNHSIQLYAGQHYHPSQISKEYLRVSEFILDSVSQLSNSLLQDYAYTCSRFLSHVKCHILYTPWHKLSYPLHLNKPNLLLQQLQYLHAELYRFPPLNQTVRISS